MTAPAKAAPMREDVTQIDREAYAEFAGNIGRLSTRDAENVRAGEWDDTSDVQWFAAYRRRLARPDAASMDAKADNMEAYPDAGDEDVERVAELGNGLIDGLKVVASTKAGQLGSCSTVALHLPLEWEEGDWLVTIETKADHEAAALAAMREGVDRGMAQFLLERLADFENGMTSEEDASEWHGHVRPAIARLSATLSPEQPR